MDTKLKNKFLTLWQQYFGEADLPMVFYYTDDTPEDVLNFTIAMKKSVSMVGNMDESFLITPSW